MAKMKLGFLASHRGSNMQAVIDACKDGTLDAEAVVVISNNRTSGALERAEAEAIPAYHISPAQYPDENELDKMITTNLSDHGVELVVLAGYMKKIGSQMLSKFNGRIINIHPSLLPRHGGQGMYGKKVHEAVIASGDKNRVFLFILLMKIMILVGYFHKEKYL